MKALLSATFVVLAGISAVTAMTSYGHASASPDEIELPLDYRDWKLVSVAHEVGNLNDLRAVLGNDMAIKTYRSGALSFPDGTVIARLAWAYTPSEENNKAFGQDQSFVAGNATNIQLMVKDSSRFASTGGWGFAQFTDGKPAAKGLSRHASLVISSPKLATMFSLGIRREVLVLAVSVLSNHRIIANWNCSS